MRSLGPFTAWAPGRVELLGNHTDYNGGLVLAAAIDRGVTVTGLEREDSIIELHSEALDRTLRFPMLPTAPLAEDAWVNYPLGVIHELRAAGIRAVGFDARIASDLPLGSGLSSSAALEVATALFYLALVGAGLPPMPLAKLCQRAENRFVGVPCGLLDQATSVFGRRQHVVLLDCRSEQVRQLAFPPGVALLLADSGTRHQLADSAYRQRREECQAAAAALGVSSLRDASTAQIAGSALPDILRGRALHVAGENERVIQAIQAFAAQKAASFGRLMNESHDSSRVNFENSTPELDLLVELARGLPGVLGSRLTGGGFGGSTVSLVETSEATSVARDLAALYRARTGLDARPFVCQLSDGAHALGSKPDS